MPDLTFQVANARAVPSLASPAIALALRIANLEDQQIDSITLRCQVQIETPRRRYTEAEQTSLLHLFGEPARWGQTLRPMLWANVASAVPAFSGSTAVDLMLPCTADPQSAVTGYFTALEGGLVPITLLFSGMTFYLTRDGQLQAAPISWSSEARFAFPVDVWKASILAAAKAGA